MTAAAATAVAPAASTAAPAPATTTPGTGGAAPPATGSHTGAPSNVVPMWTDGMADDLKGYVTVKGFKDSASVVDAYRNLEKFHGVPQDRLMKLPEKFTDDKGALTPEGAAVWARLGRPAEAKAYELPMPKEGGDPKLQEFFSQVFFEAGVPKGMATQIAGKWNGYVEGMVANAKQAAAQKLATEQTELKATWGMAFEQNVRVVDEAARVLGLSADQVKGLNGAIGYKASMELLCKLGKSVGESIYVNGGGAPGGALEPAAALAEIEALKKDAEFSNRYLNGDTEAKAKMQRLHELAYPGQRTF